MTDEFANSVGGVIRKRRRELNLTLKDLANSCGFSVSYISQIERSKRLPRKLFGLSRIAKALSMDESVLCIASRNTTVLRDDAPELLEALRDLHDFSMPLRGRSYAEESNKAFANAARLLLKHGG